MMRILAIGMLIFTGLLCSVQAQSAADKNAGLRMTHDAATGMNLMSWWGASGQTYFVQHSDDLINWTYIPQILDGPGAVDGMNFSSNGSRQFWRLQYAANSGVAGAGLDFDRDGVTNANELASGTDPFNPDSDGDGFSDGTEATAGTDSNSAASNPETDLNDVPELQVDSLALVQSDFYYYTAQHCVAQSEFNASFWTISEQSNIPNNNYSTGYSVEGSMPDVPALPARPDADSGSIVWRGEWNYVGSIFTAYLDRLVGVATTEQGFFTGKQIQCKQNWLHGTAVKYKLKVQYPSNKLRTVKVVEQRTKQSMVFNSAIQWPAPSGSPVVTSSKTLTLTLPANATDSAETVLQPDEADDNFQTTATIAKALFITPAGDPVKGPVDAGPTANTDPDSIPDGANEFTFSDDTNGVLKLKLKVRGPGVVDQSASDQAKYTFDVDAIGSSVLSWGTDNPGGKAKVDGEYLIATAIFTGLPQNNTDFGKKTVRLKYDGYELVNTKFEVFFARDEKNHPGNGAGTDPNWFYYWRQAAGAQNVNLVYDGSPPDPDEPRGGAETPGIRRWKWTEAQDKTKIIFYDLAKKQDDEYGSFRGDDIRTGIDAYFSILLHEQRHVWQVANADALLGNLVAPNSPWQYGWSWNTGNLGVSSNHYTLGRDGKPGLPNFDDDGDGQTDNLVVTARGELGWKLAQIINPPPNLKESDDVLLELGGDNGLDWPKAWPAPSPVANTYMQAYVELDAINAAMVHQQDQNAADDWANPGKNHDTKAYDD